MSIGRGTEVLGENPHQCHCSLQIPTSLACDKPKIKKEFSAFQYHSRVIFMLVVEFLFATLAFVFHENLGSTLREELTEGIRLHYNTTESNSLRNIWDHIHEEV
jgi:hypothetical protein